VNLLESNTLIRLAFTIFACYRLARMIAIDDGPLFLFKRVRYWAKDRAWREASFTLGMANLDLTIDDRHFGPWHNLAEGLSCPYCIGVWLSLPILALVLWPTYYGDLFLVLMAISGGQAFLWSLKNE